jgi:hypothetical protein
MAMSEMETHRGKLVPVTLNGVTKEERAEDACRRFLGAKKLPDTYKRWVDLLEDEGAHNIITIGDVTYRVENKELDSYGFEEASKNDDGSIDYFISFYNGSAWWGEVVESAVNGMDDEQS